MTNASGQSHAASTPRRQAFVDALDRRLGGQLRRQRRQRLLARFLSPGTLALDVGANVGEWTAAARSLGARVVAVEPHPSCLMTLRLRFASDPSVAIEPMAVADDVGSAVLHLGTTSEVSTLSDAFRDAYGSAGANGEPAAVGWNATLQVETTTLDVLIARHGTPALTKLDVEGFEQTALAGLSAQLPALCLEYNVRLRADALACIARVEQLGPMRWNFTAWEAWRLAHRDWLPAAEMLRWLAALPQSVLTGDIWAEAA